MKKYIDVDLLKNEICKNKIMSRELITQQILHIIDNQPATDAAEVAHGKWKVVGRTKSNSAILKCSCCERVRRAHGKSNYCPDCGAKMDK